MVGELVGLLAVLRVGIALSLCSFPPAENSLAWPSSALRHPIMPQLCPPCPLSLQSHSPTITHPQSITGGPKALAPRCSGDPLMQIPFLRLHVIFRGEHDIKQERTSNQNIHTQPALRQTNTNRVFTAPSLEIRTLANLPPPRPSQPLNEET